MSHRESQEGLLDLEDLQNAPKCPPYSEDGPIVSLEVEFRVYDRKKFGSFPVHARLALSGNLSIQEAAEQAFQKTSGCVPDEIDIFMKRRDSKLSSIVDKDAKIVHFFKNDDVLVLYDDRQRYTRRSVIESLINLAIVVGIIVGATALLIYVLSRSKRPKSQS